MGVSREEVTFLFYHEPFTRETKRLVGDIMLSYSTSVSSQINRAYPHFQHGPFELSMIKSAMRY